MPVDFGDTPDIWDGRTAKGPANANGVSRRNDSRPVLWCLHGLWTIFTSRFATMCGSSAIHSEGWKAMNSSSLSNGSAPWPRRPGKGDEDAFRHLAVVVSWNDPHQGSRCQHPRPPLRAARYQPHQARVSPDSGPALGVHVLRRCRHCQELALVRAGRYATRRVRAMGADAGQLAGVVWFQNCSA